MVEATTVWKEKSYVFLSF